MFLLIDKPKGLSSHAVINKVRRVTGERRVGHAGTLDPNATGLLIVGVSRDSTRKLGDLSRNTKKIYIAEIFLGEERDTDDAEGETLPHSIHKFVQGQNDNSGHMSVPTLSNVKTVIKSFLGEQMQIPPIYSAIKIKGQKAYDIARKGNNPKLAARKVTIYSIRLLQYVFPTLEIEIEVSSGTYIRSLARDIGRTLGTSAYLQNLRRTKIATYTIEKAVHLDELTPDYWQSFLVEI